MNLPSLQTIRTYDLRGDLLSVWKAEEGQMGRPHGIGLLSTGETVVSDVSMHCVHVFSDTGMMHCWLHDSMDE